MILSVMVFLAAGSSLSDAEKKQHTLYNQSVITPAVLAVCKERLPSTAAETDAQFEAWKARHVKDIAEARVLVEKAFEGDPGRLQAAIQPRLEQLLTRLRDAPPDQLSKQCAALVDTLR